MPVGHEEGTNGCSVPDVARDVGLAPEEPLSQDLVCDAHDLLYTRGGTAADRRTYDNYLYDTLRRAGMSRWRATVYWLGVRVGGWRHFNYREEA